MSADQNSYEFVPARDEKVLPATLTAEQWAAFAQFVFDVTDLSAADVVVDDKSRPLPDEIEWGVPGASQE